MIQITLVSAAGNKLAQASHDHEALLCFDHPYAPGDAIVIDVGEPCHLWFQPDVSVLPGEVFLPEGKLTWTIPAGEHRLAYRPGALSETRHIVSARRMEGPELATRRNLARNPADLRGDTDFFPHCTANVETRGESCFAARNVIDGLRFNTYHGEWPFQSWGIGARTDAWCLVDLGREVEVDQMALTLRADFPHDAYWVRGEVALSDGAVVRFPLQKTGERQFIDLGKHRVRWLRLQNMVKSDDPSAFPSLTQWEVFGADIDQI